MCVLGWVEDFEARVLKSSAQTKAPGNTPRAKACPTQNGRRGLWRHRERDGGCRAKRFRPKTRGVIIIYSKAIFKKSSHGLITCITAVLLYQNRYSRRPPWEKRKICYYQHLTRTLTLTLTRTLWGHQCLDAVVCEGSRLIQPIWSVSYTHLTLPTTPYV